MGKEAEGSGHGLIFNYYPSICLKALQKTTKSLMTVGLWTKI
jgi:hypothetical protein